MIVFASMYMYVCLFVCMCVITKSIDYMQCKLSMIYTNRIQKLMSLLRFQYEFCVQMDSYKYKITLYYSGHS